MDAFKKFFGVVAQGQSYLNMLYLLFSFPLGLFYFVFLVSGLAIGISTIIIWIGLLFLVAVFAVWYALIIFERQLAIWMLREEIAPIVREEIPNQTTWQRFVSAVKNPVTWKGLLYLFARFPLGVFSFVVLVTLLSISLSLLGAPLYYNLVSPEVDITLFSGMENPVVIDTLSEALIASLVGLLLLIGSMHVFNGLAWVSGKFARVMLGNFSSSATPPAPLDPIEPPSVEAPAAVG